MRAAWKLGSWSRIAAFAAGTALAAGFASQVRAADAMLDGDVLDPDTGRVAEIVPGAPWIRPGPDGRFGTDDDEIFPDVIGDVDLVVRTGIQELAGPIPPPTASGTPPVARAEPFAAGTPVAFVVSASDGDPAIPWGNPVDPPSLVGAPVLLVAFGDQDGDGRIGITNEDGDPADNPLEEAELIPVGRRLAVASGGRASGELSIAAGGPPGAELAVVVAAAAYAGPFDPDFLSGVVPDGPAVMTQLPFLPRTDPERAVEAGGGGLKPADPFDLPAIEIEAELEPDPGDPRIGEAFTLSTDGSEPTIDAALALSGAWSRIGLAARPDPERFRALHARPLRPGLDEENRRVVYEILQRLVVDDDGGASQAVARVVPLDRLGNVSELAVPVEVTVRTGGVVRIVAPDTDGDPAHEVVTLADARGVAVTLDDEGDGAFDSRDADVLWIEGGGTLFALDVSLPDPDVDDSGVVDRDDVKIVKAENGSVLGDPGFDPRLDVNGDGRIDGKDVRTIRAHLGEEIPTP